MKIILLILIFSCEPVGEPIMWVDPCPGQVTCALPDINQDGAVGIVDLLHVLTHWGEDTCSGGDINQDRVIGVVDFFIVLDAWIDNYQSWTWNRCDCD